jgi:teichuronic acid biosynthesis glycosyltransferase TuaC
MRRRAMSLRVLIITSQFPIAGEPNRGRPVFQTVRELAKRATVRVLSPVAVYPRLLQPKSYLARAPGDNPVAAEVDVRYVRYGAIPALTRPFNGHLAARAIASEAADFAPDVVLSYWLYPDAFAAQRVARRLRVPFVAGARGSDIRVRDAISRRLTRGVVRGARRLLVVSADLGRLAVSDYGGDPARVRVIPNGCDAAIFHPRERAPARAALGIADDAELLLYVGRLVPEKGLRELFDACTALAVARPRLRLVLVGDGPMRAELEARIARDAPWASLAGAQPPAQVAQWFAASNLLALPTYSEGHPNVLVEALACGRPAVTTPVGGIPEVVDDSVAILVLPRTVEPLRAALAAALDRDWDEAALGARFSRDWSQVATETLVACEEALAETRGKAALKD